MTSIRPPSVLDLQSPLISFWGLVSSQSVNKTTTMSLDNTHRDGDAVVLGDHVLGHGQHGLGVHPHPRNLKYIIIHTCMLPRGM